MTDQQEMQRVERMAKLETQMSHILDDVRGIISKLEGIPLLIAEQNRAMYSELTLLRSRVEMLEKAEVRNKAYTAVIGSIAGAAFSILTSIFLK